MNDDSRAQFEAWIRSYNEKEILLIRESDVTVCFPLQWSAWQAGRESMRDELRGYFREALADTGIVWPGEVDILYDRCFAEQKGELKCTAPPLRL